MSKGPIINNETTFFESIKELLGKLAKTGLAAVATIFVLAFFFADIENSDCVTPQNVKTLRWLLVVNTVLLVKHLL